MAMAIVLIPIPDIDFDPTEVAVSWLVLTRRGHVVVFSTYTAMWALHAVLLRIGTTS